MATILPSIDEPEAPLPETDDPRSEKRLAALVGGLFFIVFLGWAALVPLDAGAIATGTVTVSGNRQAVQHREGGIISALHVKEGQIVRKGQILLSISASEIGANERGLTAETYALLAQRARLIAERDGLAAMTEPPEFAALKGADLELATAAWRSQLRLFKARGSATGAQHSVLTQRSRQTREQIAGLQRQIVANRQQHKLLTDEIAGMKEIAAKGFASINRIRALERGAAQLEGEYGALNARIAQANEAIGETSMQGLSLDRGRVEEVSQELRDVDVRLDEARPKLIAVREQLARAEVRAPAGGKVVGLNVFTIGGVVAPGQMLMEIVPQDRELVVQATISPADADDIASGQQVQVRFSGIRERRLPILWGRISRMSADSFTDDRTGEHFFRAEIRVPESELEKIRAFRVDGNAIQAGLPAEVVVPLRKRSALDYLLEPLTHSLWLAGREE